MRELPLVVITGPTASGKSDLALQLAERFSGEIICADSRTIYKGLDIGTAKPDRHDQARVKHHLLDVASPNEDFNLKDFQTLAYKAIDDIRSQSKIPFLVGGSGLYVDSVVLDYQLEQPADPAQRARLETLDAKELRKRLVERGIELPQNPLNKRHLIRRLEKGNSVDKKKSRPDDNIIVVAITTDKVRLGQRIEQRAQKMFNDGIEAESASISAKYGWNNKAMSGNIYPILRLLQDGEIDRKRAIELFVAADRGLVKRQLTWLRRHKFVHWLTNEEAYEFISKEIEHRKTG